MYSALLVATVAVVAAEKQDVSKESGLYMYDDPPLLLRFFWVAGTICAVLAVCISVYNIKNHAACATLQGFGQDELISSFGARDSRRQTVTRV